MDRKIEKKRFTPKKIALISGGVLIFALLIFLVLTGSSNSTYSLEKSRATIEKVVFDDFRDVVPIQGTVEPKTTIYITAPEGGNVEEIFVEDGTMVEEGTPLLRLSNSTLMLDYMNRETQIIEQINNLRNTRLSIEENKRATADQLIDVQYQLNEAERQYTMDSSLFAQAVISEDEFLDSRNNTVYLRKKENQLKESMAYESRNRQLQLGRIERSIDLMERNLDAIRNNLENLVIKAPISGQLTSFNPELGESKSRGQQLGTIDVLDGYKVSAMIDEFYLSRIRVGQTGTFSQSNRSYGLQVSRVIPEVSGGQFEAQLVFSDSIPASITRGQTLQIKLALSNTTQAVLVPRGGFYQSTGGNWIFVMASDDKAIRREIKLGRQNTEYIEVLEGLAEGEEVVTNSYTAFGDATELNFKMDN